MIISIIMRKFTYFINSNILNFLILEIFIKNFGGIVPCFIGYGRNRFFTFFYILAKHFTKNLSSIFWIHTIFKVSPHLTFNFKSFFFSCSILNRKTNLFSCLFITWLNSNGIFSFMSPRL